MRGMRANEHDAPLPHTVREFAAMGARLAVLDRARFAEVTALVAAILEGAEAAEHFRRYGLPALADATSAIDLATRIIT